MADAEALREQAGEDAFLALRDLARRIGSAKDERARGHLLQLQAQLTATVNELLGLRLEGVTDAGAPVDTLAELRTLAGELSAAAGEVKSASDACAATSAVLGQVQRLVAKVRMTTA